MAGTGRTAQWVILVSLATILGCSSDSNVEDEQDVTVEEEGPFPPDDDPSAFTGPAFGELDEDLPHTNQGSFEGGATESPKDAGQNNVLPKAAQRDAGVFNVPTNGAPSPMFGAQPFSQKLLRFEEFGLDPLDLERTEPGENWEPLPAPLSAQGMPDTGALDDFIAQVIWPVPTKYANDIDTNPWQGEIEAWLGRGLDTPPAEGRPPGLGWSHQRWNDFTPREYFQTVQAGARTNRGVRDAKQNHGYVTGEFAPGGLYHNTARTRV